MDAPQEGYYPYQASIDAYGNGGFRFAEMSHRGSLLCLPGGMRAWSITAANELDLAAFAPVLAEADAIDVLLIGMGQSTDWISEELRAELREHKIIVEETDTGGAIRTYNILLAEHRAVAAALIAVERT